MTPPPSTLDGAEVLFWFSRNTPIYFIKEGESEHPITAMAICRYGKNIASDEKYYLFKCDVDWNVIMDMDYRSVEEAMAAATQWHIHLSEWQAGRPNGGDA